MPIQGSRIEVARGPWLEGEMPETIFAANERGRVLVAVDLVEMRGGVADRVTDTPIIRVVGARSVDQLDVVQGHLTRLQHDVDRRFIVHFRLDHLTP